MSADVLVTSFAPDAAEAYGNRGTVSMWNRWPQWLSLYLDAPLPWTPPSGARHLTGEIVGWPETRRRLPVSNPDAAKPTNYIWNARKYAVKVFVWCDAAERLASMSSACVTWLDADTVTHAQVPYDFSRSLLGDAAVAYLGRGAMHPETGFVAFRIPDALPLLRWMRDAYRDGTYAQWTDGWTDCHALRHGLAAVPVKAADLTSHAYDGEWRSTVDAFALSPLAPYVRHLKGQQAKREAACVI